MDDSESLLNEFESLYGFAPVDVPVCRPRLRMTILGGGSATYFDGTNTRVLDAGRAIQPLIHTTPMSGLLSLIQPLLALVTPQYIQLEFYAGQKREVGDRPIWEHLYKRSELATAIEQFLRGASPTAQVLLWRAR
jgi:hypothetical protein